MSAIKHIESGETISYKHEDGSVRTVTVGGYIPKLQKYEVTYSLDPVVQVTALVPYKVIAAYQILKVTDERQPEH